MKTLEERFLEKVEKGSKPDDCWLWMGATLEGYGIMRDVGRQMLKAHRFSYELHKGPIPKGLYVIHSCDVRRCVNPNHIRVGTAWENIQDIPAERRSRIRKKMWASLSPEERAERVANVAKSLTGKKMSKEARANMRAAKLGKPAKLSDEAKARKNASIKRAWASGRYINRGKDV